MDDATSMNDVFEKLFKNPTKLMGLVKNVGTKLDNKIKSGEIKESELIEEAQDMVENMQNIPGMGSMQDLFTKMGMGGMGGGKMNMNAMRSQMSQNLRQAKMKERMQRKLAEKNKQQEPMTNISGTQEPIVFSTGEKVEKTLRSNNKKKSNRKKKNKQKK